MKPIPKLLSKTRLMRGYRCHKCIYLNVHYPALEAPINAETQALFDQGNDVGKAAQQCFPGGVLVENAPWDFSGALKKTRALIAAGTPVIFEAAFEYMGCYARADILEYVNETKRYRIYEVKSSTKVKPEHLDDAGLQVWIMAKSGLPIEQIFMMHLNPACRYPDLTQLFLKQDITSELRAKYLSIQPTIHEIMSVLQRPEIPDIDIGPYCHEPNTCGFVAHCWSEKHIPPLSIFNLPGMHQRQWQLYREGIIALDDPRLTDLTEQQATIVHAYQTGERKVDHAAIQQALCHWQYPLIFLDFETINPAIPRYDGTGPFQQVPFQFSVHRLDSINGTLTHQAFLYDKNDDPRPTLIPALLAACGESGSIVAYYSKFEITRIQELAAYSPAHQDALHQLITRMVDPLPIIREHVYDNAFAGSFSLKKVAPALLGNDFSYQSMLVADGGAAQRAFMEMIADKTSDERKAELKQALLDYCEQDTLVMVELVKWLTLCRK